MTCFAVTMSRSGVIAFLLMLVITVMIGVCHGDGFDQQASRMMVLRDLPDSIEPTRPQHLIIRTGYEVWSRHLYQYRCFELC